MPLYRFAVRTGLTTETQRAQLAKEVVRIVRENDFTEHCILTSLDYAGLRRADPVRPARRALRKAKTRALVVGVMKKKLNVEFISLMEKFNA